MQEEQEELLGIEEDLDSLEWFPPPTHHSDRAGSYLRRIDFVYHSTLGLIVIKKRRRRSLCHPHHSIRVSVILDSHCVSSASHCNVVEHRVIVMRRRSQARDVAARAQGWMRTTLKVEMIGQPRFQRRAYLSLPHSRLPTIFNLKIWRCAYRGTSLIRNCLLLGIYSGPTPRDLW